ncbi:NHL repeat protein [Necator americanus]|uniref:NHL repeat protein n=1 Tax=Necator americanus TaxID=51031 RepID=W2TK54_NECAM|nr:NHL repeat protein [Necator americanus]ETN82178.1 NHL repeat protein [Necator americanus]
MLVDAYPHLRSPVSCLFYQFVFKRYIEDDVFTDEELDCIQNEIARVVRRFDELGLDHYSFEANTLPQILEVVERFNEIKAYRSCQDAICSEYEKESTSSSNGNNGGSSESHMETNAKLTNIQFPAVSSDGERDHADRRSHLDSSPQSKYSPGNVNDNTGASPTMSSAYAGESKEDSRSSKKCNVVNTEFVSKKPVLSRSTIPSSEAGIEVSVSGSLSQKFEGKGFNRPLGVTFDEESQQWIVADTMNNRIVLVPRGVIMTSSDIIAPSAVTVLRPAYSFVVLTKCEIRILHYGKSVANGKREHSHYGENSGFLASIGTQSIVKFYDDTGTDRFKHNRSITLAPDSKNGRRGTVSYISGVFIDEDFNLLIADAKGRSLQVFNNDCVYLYSVKLLGGGFPFISKFFPV